MYTLTAVTGAIYSNCICCQLYWKYQEINEIYLLQAQKYVGKFCTKKFIKVSTEFFFI